MKIARKLRVEASPDKVWDILGPNYVRAGDWASSVYVSGARPGTPKVAGAPHPRKLKADRSKKAAAARSALA